MKNLQKRMMKHIRFCQTCHHKFPKLSSELVIGFKLTSEHFQIKICTTFDPQFDKFGSEFYSLN